jgi:hypothetical protein
VPVVSRSCFKSFGPYIKSSGMDVIESHMSNVPWRWCSEAKILFMFSRCWGGGFDDVNALSLNGDISWQPSRGSFRGF